jgi:hypothetical protein
MNPIQSLIALGLAAYTAAWLHEGSHYFVGWIGQSRPRMQFAFKVQPTGVYHDEIKTMDSELIRMSGISIFVWIPVTLLALAFFALNPTPAYLFLAATPLLVTMSATESDAIAARNPEKFREMAVAEEFERNPLFIPNVI